MAERTRGLVAGRYRLGKLLGEGGMGRVWEARDELLGRDVAVKEIAPRGLSAGELGDLRERAIREARAIAMVEHPHVVRIFDVVSDEGVPWIVMELVRSRSLHTVVEDEGPMDPARAARIGLEVLAALRSAHRAGILHRDVKPANVLLGDDGRAVLTDFGLAAVAGDSGMTGTGVVLGSPSYLAPERALDEPAGPASDLWSLGATLFAAVEGRPPYGKSSAMATLASLMVDPPPVPQHAGVLRPVLEALLTKDPAERAGTNEAERLLHDAANGFPTNEAQLPLRDAVHEALAPDGTRRRRVVLTAVAVVIVGAASAAIVLTNRGPHDVKAVPATTMPSITGPASVSARPSATPSAKPSASGPVNRAPLGVAPSNAHTTTRPPATKAAPVVKPAAAARTLAATFNNVGVTDDAHTTAGNFDGGGATYSAQAFAAGGTTPGKTLTVGGVPLTWPATAGTGRKDNAIAAGQTIAVPGSGSRLAFLVAGDYGAVSAGGRITYTDGSTQAYTLAAPDWFDTGDPAAAAVSGYQNRAGAERYDEPAAVFGATVTLTDGKTVASVRLPTVGAVPAREGTTTLHVFAARIG